MEKQCIDSMLGDMDSLLLFSVHIFSIGNHHSSVQIFNQVELKENIENLLNGILVRQNLDAIFSI